MTTSEEYRERFAEHLRSYMPEHWTARTLYDELQKVGCDVAYPTVRHFLNGTRLPPVDTLDSLTEVLRIPRGRVFPES